LGATATAWTFDIEFPITDEFIKKNYLTQVKSDSLKFYFKSLSSFRDNFMSINDYVQNQYLNNIEPYFIKHINYSEVAIQKNRNKLVFGGPSTNYEDLLNSLELWNVVTLKLETSNISRISIQNFIKFLNKMIVRLEEETNQ
jgi:hypothetical protein